MTTYGVRVVSDGDRSLSVVARGHVGMQWNGHDENFGSDRSLSRRLTALALAVGIAFAAAQGEARAETGEADAGSGGALHSAPAQDPAAGSDVAQAGADEGGGTPPATNSAEPLDNDDHEDAEVAAAAEPAAPTDQDAVESVATEETSEPTDTPAAVEVVESAAPQTVDPAPATHTTSEPVVAEPDPITASPAAVERRATPTVEPEESPATSLRTLTLEPSISEPAPQRTTAAVVTVTEPVVRTGPKAPEPLSPIAELLQLPGRIVNAVLQLFGFTVGDGTKTPITFAPINDLLFAVFRGLERLLGLDKTPAVQQVVPTLTYTGPTTATTPTVAQFLNASAAEYVLGGLPDDLVPFTVNGFQMAQFNLFSGMAAKAWVTADQQIVIAYQGTTGGTNLLFNPLIAISQILADLQVIFTDTTPWAFYDALRFAREVEAEAVKQGYGDGAIFVTGHSLGGWEAEYVAQQTGWGGIGFESPGLNTVVAGNGANSNFVNIETYGDAAAYMSTDLPGLYPFMPAYVAGGGSKPHYGSIVMIGDPEAATPLINVAALWGKTIIGSVIFVFDFLVNFFAYHLPGVQAYHLGVEPAPGVVTWLGTAVGPVETGDYGDMTIPELLQAASEDQRLFTP